MLEGAGMVGAGMCLAPEVSLLPLVFVLQAVSLPTPAHRLPEPQQVRSQRGVTTACNPAGSLHHMGIGPNRNF